MQKVFLIAIISIVLAACAKDMSIPKESNYNQAVGSWRDETSDKLVKVWGVPTKRIISRQDGNIIYEYKKQNVKTVPGYTQPGQIVPAGMGGQAQDEYAPGYSTNMNTYASFCTTSFEMDMKDTIISIRSEGNYCKMTNSELKRRINPAAVNIETLPMG